MVRRSSGAVGEEAVIDSGGVRVLVEAGGKRPRDRGGWQTVDHAEDDCQRALSALEGLLAIAPCISAPVQGVQRTIGRFGGRIGMFAVKPDARHHLGLEGQQAEQNDPSDGLAGSMHNQEIVANERSCKLAASSDAMICG